jgi:hypothetical protein
MKSVIGVSFVTTRSLATVSMRALPTLLVFMWAARSELPRSPNCEVRGNSATGANGIGMLQQDRTDSCTFLGAPNYPDGTPVCPGDFHQVHDTYIHDNTSTETGVSGSGAEIACLDEDVGDQRFFTSENNRFIHNTYTCRVLRTFTSLGSM